MRSMRSMNCCTNRCVSTANRMPVILSVLSTWIAIFGAYAGDLNPPPGPVAPTMKTLTEVEPRIAINSTNTPGNSSALFRITQPGSYYLTGNVIGESGKMGIEVSDGDITIDLMGFELIGVPGSLDGIKTTNMSVYSLEIRNGIIRNWGGDGIEGNSASTVLSDLRVNFNSGNGISGGRQVTHCTAFDNGGDGIQITLNSTVNDCVANNNTRGIVSIGAGCTLTGCTANSNSSFGIATSAGSTLTACTAHNNQSNGGISVGQGSTVTGCTAYDNQGFGINADNGGTVTGCTVSFNSTDGIVIGPKCRVTDNLCSNNSNGAGIYTASNGSRIEGNTVSGNGFGIFLFGSVTGNMVIRNHATVNASGNYVTPASGGNFIGTIITTSGNMNAATNSLINISF